MIEVTIGSKKSPPLIKEYLAKKHINYEFAGQTLFYEFIPGIDLSKLLNSSQENNLKVLKQGYTEFLNMFYQHDILQIDPSLDNFISNETGIVGIDFDTFKSRYHPDYEYLQNCLGEYYYICNYAGLKLVRQTVNLNTYISTERSMKYAKKIAEQKILKNKTHNNCVPATIQVYEDIFNGKFRME